MNHSHSLVPTTSTMTKIDTTVHVTSAVIIIDILHSQELAHIHKQAAKIWITMSRKSSSELLLLEPVVTSKSLCCIRPHAFPLFTIIKSILNIANQARNVSIFLNVRFRSRSHWPLSVCVWISDSCGRYSALWSRQPYLNCPCYISSVRECICGPVKSVYDQKCATEWKKCFANVALSVKYSKRSIRLEKLDVQGPLLVVQ